MTEYYQQYMYSYPHKTAYRALHGICFYHRKELLEQSSPNSLYFHIPFCESKCGYCNLFSLTGQPTGTMEQYLSAMKRQIEQYELSDITFNDWTIGGGTPLLLPEHLLEQMLLLAKKYIRFSGSTGVCQDITIETSPRQTTSEKLALLKEHHIRRVSIGVQSFHDSELQTLHRSHKASDARKALSLLKDFHFPCLNLDLIYGIPGQTSSALSYSLDAALSFEPDEIFLYPLYVKPGTRLSVEHMRRDKDAARHYQLLREKLSERGYLQTSMRRFIKISQKKSPDPRRRNSSAAPDLPNPSFPDHQTTQGCGYSDSTISIGCGGRSYIGNLHFCSPYSVRPATCQKLLKRYMETMDFQPITHGFLLSENEQKRKYIIKNLFHSSGLPLTPYDTLFGGSVKEDFPILKQWITKGYAYQTEDTLFLTTEGMELSDYLGPMLISPEVKKRMEEWNDEG